MFSKTSIQNLSDAWWPKPTAPSSPLASLHTAVDCLQRGVPIPEPAASVLLDGLLRVMAGSKFEQALGLRAAQSGQRTPVQIAAMERRNGLIRSLADLLPGNTGDKADTIAALLTATTRHRCGILEADQLAAELRSLKLAGLELPTSARQIRRVIGRK